MGIKSDLERFKNIIRGKVKENLKEFISNHEMVGKKEDEFVKIPIPRIDIPNFRFGSSDEKDGGVGQGQEGQKGDPANAENSGAGNEAGRDAGDHELYSFKPEELAEMLAEELELPKILPKGKNQIEKESQKYSSIAPQGPKGLKHFKRTYKNTLKRMVSSGQFDPDGMMIPVKNDFKYKSAKTVKSPDSQAVIFYIMDVSGSMGSKEKSIAKTEAFWINLWLKSNYKKIESKYIIHESVAKEVSEDEFFNTSENGGTLISSSYTTLLEIIKDNYDSSNWNIYVFQFSDGDNWSTEDSKKCLDLLDSEILKRVNSFNYCELQTGYGSGNFSKELEESSINKENLVISIIKKKEDIPRSIKDFFKKGK